jgi:hypothetical protein
VYAVASLDLKAVAAFETLAKAENCYRINKQPTHACRIKKPIRLSRRELRDFANKLGYGVHWDGKLVIDVLPKERSS